MSSIKPYGLYVFFKTCAHRAFLRLQVSIRKVPGTDFLYRFVQYTNLKGRGIWLELRVRAKADITQRR